MLFWSEGKVDKKMTEYFVLELFGNSLDSSASSYEQLIHKVNSTVYCLFDGLPTRLRHILKKSGKY